MSQREASFDEQRVAVDEIEFVHAKLASLEGEVRRLEGLESELRQVRQSLDVLLAERDSLEAALVTLRRYAEATLGVEGPCPPPPLLSALGDSASDRSGTNGKNPTDCGVH